MRGRDLKISIGNGLMLFGAGALSACALFLAVTFNWDKFGLPLAISYLVVGIGMMLSGEQEDPQDAAPPWYREFRAILTPIVVVFAWPILPLIANVTVTKE